MAIAFTNLGTSAAPDFDSNSDANSYASASWTPPTSGLILLAVCWTKATNVGNVPTVSGNNITWVNLGDRQVDIGTFAPGVVLFGANASGATTGATTIDFNGETQSSCTALFCQVTGVDLSGGVAAAIVQEVESSAVTPGTSASVQTIAALGNAANRLYGAVLQQQIGQDQVTSPDPQWTALDNFNSLSPAHSVVSQYHPSGHESAMTASWATQAATTGGWVGIAIELKAILATDYSVTITASVGLADAATDSRSLTRTVAEALGITDALTATRALLRSVADGVGLGDVIGRSRTLYRQLASTVGFMTTLGKSRTLYRVLADGLGLGDVASRSKGFRVVISDVIGFTTEVAATAAMVFSALAKAVIRGSRAYLVTLDGSRITEVDLDGSIDE